MAGPKRTCQGLPEPVRFLEEADRHYRTSRPAQGQVSTLHGLARTRTTPRTGTQLWPEIKQPVDAGTRILADLHRDADERAWVSLSGTDGRTVELRVDGAPSRSSRSTPAMTCPPSALQSGEQVIRLAPGQSASATIAGAGGRGGNLRPFGGKIFWFRTGGGDAVRAGREPAVAEAPGPMPLAAGWRLPAGAWSSAASKPAERSRSLMPAGWTG